MQLEQQWNRSIANKDELSAALKPNASAIGNWKTEDILATEHLGA